MDEKPGKEHHLACFIGDYMIVSIMFIIYETLFDKISDAFQYLFTCLEDHWKG